MFIIVWYAHCLKMQSSKQDEWETISHWYGHGVWYLTLLRGSDSIGFGFGGGNHALETWSRATRSFLREYEIWDDDDSFEGNEWSIFTSAWSSIASALHAAYILHIFHLPTHLPCCVLAMDRGWVLVCFTSAGPNIFCYYVVRDHSFKGNEWVYFTLAGLSIARGFVHFTSYFLYKILHTLNTCMLFKVDSARRMGVVWWKTPYFLLSTLIFTLTPPQAFGIFALYRSRYLYVVYQSNIIAFNRMPRTYVCDIYIWTWGPYTEMALALGSGWVWCRLGSELWGMWRFGINVFWWGGLCVWEFVIMVHVSIVYESFWRAWGRVGWDGFEVGWYGWAVLCR